MWRHYFHPLLRQERRRRAYLQANTPPEFLAATLAPAYPGLNVDACDLEYICLDLETTGLQASDNQILSIGWVEISQMKLDLTTAVELMVQDGQQISREAAIINHITPEMLHQGIALDSAMEQFFAAASGKVIVVHGSMIELPFISHYLQHRGQPEPPLLWLDTLAIENYLCRTLEKESQSDLRLPVVRSRYALPEYSSHGALIDAIATGELLLAQLQRIFRSEKRCFGRVYKLSQQG